MKKNNTLIAKLFRLSNYFNKNKFSYISKMISLIIRFIYSCDIPSNQNIHQSVVFQHNGLGIVIHKDAIILENTIIMQNVTIGGNLSKSKILDEKIIKAPIIGKNVFIGPNACILGPISIGDNSIIGAGSVVIEDVPCNVVVGGIPAKIIKNIND